MITRLLYLLAIFCTVTITSAQEQRAASPNNDKGGNILSFEKAKAGQFEKLATEIGTWIPEQGKTIVDDKNAKTGNQCLQLTGNEKTSILLLLADGVDTSGDLTFWAERWTKSAPFTFRIEKRDGEDWKEIYNGDRQVKVGRAFLSTVRVHLGDPSIRELRFIVQSPPNTGLLIDDIRIAPARPQRIISAEVVPFTLPALVGVERSPLLKLGIETEGQLNPISVTEIHATLTGAAEVAQLQVLQGDQSLGSPVARGTEPIVFSTKGELAEGENIVWITCELEAGSDIDRRIGAALQQLTFSNGEMIAFDDKPSVQRLGVGLRNGGDDGVHTYRIPGLATTNQGSLIGVYDVRRRGGGDLPGDIDVGMSRSTDGGKTWEPMKVIMDMGDDPEWNYDGVGDPAVLVDGNTGTIWVAGTWSHGNRSWRGSGPGLKPEETGQLMLVRSDDDGVTWSEPINITKQVKKSEWCFILQGPGKGITMQDGTLVFAAQYQDPPNQNRLPHSTILYSKDHGETWQVGTGAFDDTTEAQVVEIEPGVLMLNCRYNRKGMRVVMTTSDLGRTWEKHPSSERALIEPGACMASLIDTGDWLLFSNPNSTKGRNRITIKGSPDRGLTWPQENQVLLDEGNGRGYSCLSMIDERTIGILYEGSEAHMTFQRILLSDLVGERKGTKE